MVSPNLIAGAGIPFGWTLEGAREALRKQNSQPQELVSHPINILQDSVVGDIIADNLWPVRNQRARATCNAFAVVAAEELARFRIAPHENLIELSEEHFYAAIRKIPLDEAGIEVSPHVKLEQEASGLTYLSQAKLALMEFGLCERELMPYVESDDPAFAVATIPANATRDGNIRRLNATQLIHNIIDTNSGPTPPHKLNWKLDLEFDVSTLFKQQLGTGMPVVASFAILASGSWFGHPADEWGEVVYSRGLDLVVGQPIGGHTVCIIGYEPPERGDNKSGGWFRFRNSHGERFARYFKDDAFPPRSLGKGYGHISAADVNVYCWEYLFRLNVDPPTN